MNNDDSDSFKQAMKDVLPLKSPQKLRFKKTAAINPSIKARRLAALGLIDKYTEILPDKDIDLISPHATLSFQRSGIQHRAFKKLRMGKYQVESYLDLHGMSVKQARKEIQHFINDCSNTDIRCVLINHGKGEKRFPQPALLKSCVASWLPQLDTVLAFCSAKAHHGGVGATYVMLRKKQIQQ